MSLCLLRSRPAAAIALAACVALAGCKSSRVGAAPASSTEQETAAHASAAQDHPPHHDAHGGSAADAPAAGRHHLPAAASPFLGKSVPDFTLFDSGGKQFRLHDARSGPTRGGKIIVLTFWCTTCSSCRLVEKDFDAMARELAGKDVELVMVDSNFNDDAARVNAFLAQRGLGFRVLLDPHGHLAHLHGATLTTTTAVIGADGRMRYYGAYKGAEPALNELLAGKEVSVPAKPAEG